MLRRTAIIEDALDRKKRSRHFDAGLHPASDRRPIQNRFKGTGQPSSREQFRLQDESKIASRRFPSGFRSGGIGPFLPLPLLHSQELLFPFFDLAQAPFARRVSSVQKKRCRELRSLLMPHAGISRRRGS
jgi:hypothetical protein